MMLRPGVICPAVCFYDAGGYTLTKRFLGSRNSEFKQRMQDEIERCRAENIIPGPEQDKLLQKIEAEIVVFQSQIEDEWRAAQGKKK